MIVSSKSGKPIIFAVNHDKYVVVLFYFRTSINNLVIENDEKMVFEDVLMRILLKLSQEDGVLVACGEKCLATMRVDVIKQT